MANELQTAHIYTHYQGVLRHLSSRATFKTAKNLAFDTKEYLSDIGVKFDSVKVMIEGKSYYCKSNTKVRRSSPREL